MSGRPDDEHRGGRMRVLVLAWVEVEIESTQTPTAAVEVVDLHGRMPDRGPRNPAIPHPEYPARDREQSGPDLPELEIRTEQLRVEGVRFGAHDFGVVVQVPALERVRPRDIATLPGEQFLVIATLPSSPGGCAFTKSSGRPSRSAGATRTERTSSRMFLSNSCPIAVISSRNAFTRARVASSRSTPAKWKSLRIFVTA